SGRCRALCDAASVPRGIAGPPGQRLICPARSGGLFLACRLPPRPVRGTPPGQWRPTHAGLNNLWLSACKKIAACYNAAFVLFLNIRMVMRLLTLLASWILPLAASAAVIVPQIGSASCRE